MGKIKKKILKFIPVKKSRKFAFWAYMIHVHVCQQNTDKKKCMQYEETLWVCVHKLLYLHRIDLKYEINRMCKH